jgi:phosphoglucosamine mutase
MRKLFGTDGVRGVANAELSPDLALALGRAAARFGRERGAERPAVLVGRDTRRSSVMLEDALSAGVASAGGVARRAGVLPTPGVAWLVRQEEATLGAVISASHNPFPDNGIKLFGGDGYKLSDAEEARIEALLEEDFDPPTGAGVGTSEPVGDAAERYAEFLASIVDVDVRGLRLAVDCANGAASAVAPAMLDRLGASYTLLAAQPDGVNINVDSGSTHLDHVATTVRDGDFDLGLAFDGDADRLLCVDGEGRVVDGDHVLAILARDLLEREALPGRLVVLTTMANLGLHRALRALDVRTVVTDVGDRYVLEAMRRDGAVLGGEQSGHIIALDRQTTGDGAMTAALLLSALARRGESLTEAASLVEKFPQRLVNVRADRGRLPGAEAVWAAVAEVERELGDEGRVVLRPSGTEPLVRVMVEAPTVEDCERISRNLADVVQRELALVPSAS